MKAPAWGEVRYHAARWVWVAGLAALAYVAFPSSTTDLAPLLEPGAVADRDVVAPFNFVVTKSGQEIQREADELAASVKPIYQFQQAVYDSTLATVRALFAAVEDAADGGAPAVQAAARRFGVTLTPAEAAYLTREGKRRALETALQQLLERTLGRGAARREVLEGEPSRELIIRRRNAELAVPRDQVVTHQTYLAQAKALHPDRASSTGDAVYLKLVNRFFRATIVLDRELTERRRAELRGSVDPRKYFVAAGEVIVAAGSVVTSDAHERLLALHQELVRRGAATTLSVPGVLGPVLRNALILSVFWVLLLFYRRETYRELRQVAMIAGLFALTILGAAAVARLVPLHPELIPIPFMAVMMTVLFNGRVSMIAVMIVSVLVGLQPVFHDAPALFLCLAGGVPGALSVRSLRRRSHLYAAVLWAGAGYLLGSLAVGLTAGWSALEIGQRAALGIGNGLVSASLTFALLPGAEKLSQITTDLTLLELSDPSRPLLRRLSLEAPGTYAHSIAMANLVEAACNRIGANGLLGRVGCYYHDVGKLLNPQYFVENQTYGGNPHDRLRASQSVEIIKAHVTEGLKLAEQAGLPSTVAAFIPEHHGTSEITYFLDRARKQGDGDASSDHYRYPGPKPRSAETAIAMMADSVEAALRVLEDLTPERIEEAIDHIVKTKLNAGQLSEAPMTLQQIEEVKREFVRVLSSMYHNRIDYPEASGGISANWKPPADA
ncbi:MAG TPA: HDIG domain-containing protein [Gemmatimonadales bacterium]|nr:HDIG domain-containing protein [Gemmatimonadales bacterium]